MKIQEIRGKTDYELQNETAKLRKELFDMQFKAKTQGLASPSRIPTLKRLIARVQTVLQERASGTRGQAAR